MARPVIIDDGGSIRIRSLTNNAKLDGLLSGAGATPYQDTNTDVYNGGAGGSFQCFLTVRFLEESGAHHVLPTAANGGPISLLQTDTVVITAANGQVATVTFNNNFRAVIALSFSALVFPSVNAKLDPVRMHWHYTVENAGIIQTVVLNPATTNRTVYPDPAVNGISMITVVHLNPNTPPNDQLHREERQRHLDRGEH